jgi:hypothetical protein
MTVYWASAAFIPENCPNFGPLGEFFERRVKMHCGSFITERLNGWVPLRGVCLSIRQQLAVSVKVKSLLRYLAPCNTSKQQQQQKLRGP